MEMDEAGVVVEGQGVLISVDATAAAGKSVERLES